MLRFVAKEASVAVGDGSGGHNEGGTELRVRTLTTTVVGDYSNQIQLYQGGNISNGKSAIQRTWIFLMSIIRFAVFTPIQCPLPHIAVPVVPKRVMSWNDCWKPLQNS